MTTEPPANVTEERPAGKKGRETAKLINSGSKNSSCEAALAKTTVDALLEAGGSGAYNWQLIAGCALCYSTSGFVTGLPVFLLPMLQEPWGLTGYGRALVSSLFFAGNLVGLLFWGAFADRFGRRFCLRIGLVLLLVTGLRDPCNRQLWRTIISPRGST